MKIITNNYAECYFPTDNGEVNIRIGVNSVSDSDYSAIKESEMFKTLLSDGRFVVPEVKEVVQEVNKAVTK
jgi:hypothetical protein